MSAKIVRFPSIDISSHKTAALEQLASAFKNKWAPIRASQFRKSFSAQPKNAFPPTYSKLFLS